MKKNVFLNMHETFTDESNAVIKLDELREFMKDLSFSEQSEYLVEFLKLSDASNKEHLREIMEYVEYLEKRNFSANDKRKVVEVKKVKTGQKKYFNDVIKNYDDEIKNIISLNFDDFKKYIEENDIDANHLMLGIIKEINLYKSFADDAYINKEMDMILEAKSIMMELQTKLDYLKDKSKTIINVLEEKRYRIIFLDTSSMRTYFLEDIKGLEEYYDSFNKIFSSLEKGNPNDVKYFASVDKNLEGLAETRDVSGKTRIFFKKLNEDTYIVIGAMVKKVDRTAGYKNQLENRYKYYLQQEDYIMSHLDDEEFSRLQEEHLEEVKKKIKGGLIMLSVINLIETKMNELKSINIDNDSVEFLKMFNTNVSSLCNCEFINLVICFYMVKKEKCLEDAMNAINEIRPFLEDMEELDYEDVLCLVDNFCELKEKYEERLVSYQYNDYMSLKIRNDETLDDTKEMLNNYSSMLSIDEINSFLIWMNDDELADIICLAACLKGIKENLGKIDESVEDLEIPDFFGSKLTRKLSEGYIKDVNGSYIKAMNEELNDDIEELRSYRDKKISEVTSLRRSINKQLKNLQELIDSFNKNRLTVDNLLKLTDDEKIRYFGLLELVNRKNEEYDKNYQELESYRKNPINKLEKIFHDYNFNFNLLLEDEHNQLMSLSNEEKIKENLSFFSSSNLRFLTEKDEVFIHLLLLDMENLMQIDSLLARGKITQEFILKYGCLLDALTIKILVRNINKLDMQKVDFTNLSKYKDKIILDLNVKLFDLIVAYNIDLKNPNLKQYEFLENPKLLDIIDGFIEIGLYNQIKSLPNLINDQSSNVIKRIILMNQIGEDYLNERNTLNQMARSGKDFYLGDDLLDDYTYANYQMYMDEEILRVLSNKDNIELLEEIPEEIKFIESYKKNDQVYMIGSNCFSRIKVLRCLKTLRDLGYNDYKEMLFNVLIYNYPNYLSIETIEELKNIDKNILKKQLK